MTISNHARRTQGNELVYAGSFRKHHLLLWVTVLLLSFAVTTAWSNENLAVLTEIPIETGANAAQPSLSVDTESSFVLTWQEQEGRNASLKFARISPAGRVDRQGTIATSSPDQTWFVNWADFPSLAVLDNGDWVTFWLQKSGPATYAYDINLTRSTDEGQSWSQPVVLNRDATQSEHGFVSLAPAGEDRVLAIWLDGRHTVGQPGAAESVYTDHSGGMTLRSAVVNRAGEFSQKFEIDSLTCDCCGTDLVRVGDQFMAIYRDRTEAEVRDSSFSILTAAEGWSEPKTVHDDQWQIAACPVNGPALAFNDGLLLAAWTTMQGEDLSVRTAPGDLTGFGDMIELDAGDQVQGRVDAVALGKQDFLLSWLGKSDVNPEGTAVRIARFNPQTGLGAAQTVAELPRGRSTGFPRMASHGNQALIAWTEPRGDGNSIRVVRLSTHPFAADEVPYDPAPAPSWHLSPDLEIRELQPGIWVHTSWQVLSNGLRYPSNGLIVREENSVLLIDTAWGDASTIELLDWIDLELGVPVSAVIATHSHDDRMGGAPVLAERGIPLYAHPLSIPLALGKGLPEPRSVGHLKPGGAVEFGAVEVFYPGPAHTVDNIMVWLPESRLLVGGCAVKSNDADSMGNVADANLDEWPNSIRRAAEQYPGAVQVLPGHGDIGGPELLMHTTSLLERKK